MFDCAFIFFLLFCIFMGVFIDLTFLYCQLRNALKTICTWNLYIVVWFSIIPLPLLSDYQSDKLTQWYRPRVLFSRYQTALTAGERPRSKESETANKGAEPNIPRVGRLRTQKLINAHYTTHDESYPRENLWCAPSDMGYGLHIPRYLCRWLPEIRKIRMGQQETPDSEWVCKGMVFSFSNCVFFKILWILGGEKWQKGVLIFSRH